MPKYNPPFLIQLSHLVNKTLLCCVTFFVFQANAATIHYQATDLTDTSVVEDLWRYTYTVSDHSFIMDTGFSIFFAPALYSDLQNPAPSGITDWDILVIGPNLLTPDDGIYDALALVNNPSILTLFSVDFVWLGASMPESQQFEVYDANFNVLASGNTLNKTHNVPIPPANLLLGSGLLLLVGFRKREADFHSRTFYIQQEISA